MKSLIILLFCILQTVFANASTYYIDNAVTASGNGLSWVSAWKNFSNINWSIVRPGDTILISGGTVSKTYFETLTVGASGSAQLPIRIERASDAGHNGEVIIDSQNTRFYGVVVESRNFVTVKGLKVRNVNEAGFRIRFIQSEVLIENNSVDAGNPTSNSNTRGYDVRNSSGVTIRGNSYSTPTSSRAQTDGIWSSGNNGVSFQKNRIIISNSYTAPDEGHNDCLQSYTDVNIEVIGNYCEQNNSKTGNSQGIFIQNLSGLATVYNNIVYSPNTNSGCIIMENLSGSGFNGAMNAYHNSAYGCAYGTIHIVNSPNSIAKNNILVSPGTGAQAFKIVGVEPARSNINYNLLYTPNSNYPAYIQGQGVFTWSNWQARGYEANGINVDPQFIDIANRNLGLNNTSPAIDRAIFLASISIDYSGNLRPSGIASDLGAFEYIAPVVEPGSSPVPDPEPQPTPVPPPITAPLIFSPQADAFVMDSRPTKNYGLSSQLRADASPIVISYVRFAVNGITRTVAKAKLKIFSQSDSPVGLQAFLANNNWQEKSITYANRPPLISNLISVSPSFARGSWVEIDVTDAVNSDATLTFVIMTPRTHTLLFTSREGTLKPQLIVEQ